jgi:TPR repeat protein/Fe-S cluster biogenesis protein NfuA
MSKADALKYYRLKEYDKAYEIWLDLAENSQDSQAMVNIGLLYLKGEGREKDFGLAQNWFDLACKLDNPSGYYNLALMYQNQIGIPKDEAKALELFEKASDIGHDGASFRLGLYYTKNQTDNEVIKRGFEYMYKAAKLNHIMARTQINGFEKAMSISEKPSNDEFYAKSYEEKLAIIEDALDRYIRPMLKNDGGDITLLDLIEKDGLELRLCYGGNCSGCSLGATSTYEMIYKILSDIIDPSVRVLII